MLDVKEKVEELEGTEVGDSESCIVAVLCLRYGDRAHWDNIFDFKPFRLEVVFYEALEIEFCLIVFDTSSLLCGGY